MELILIRHPRPLVPAGICYGSSDVAVADEELAAVHAPLQPMLAELPPGTPLFSSPLQRCAALARLLSPCPVFDARLAEMDFGGWELRGWDEIGRAEVDAWAGDLLHYRPGGGETVLEVARRVAVALAAIRACGAERAVVVCHAGTIRLLQAMANGTPLEQAASAAAATPNRIGYGAVVRLHPGAMPA